MSDHDPINDLTDVVDLFGAGARRAESAPVVDDGLPELRDARPMLITITALCTIAATWAVEYAIEPSGGFGVTVYMLAGDLFHKIARAVGVV